MEEIFRKYRKSIMRFYRRQTGEKLPEVLDIFQIKDLVGRWLFWLYFDEGFRQNGIEDRIDGTASGTACEIKCNTHGFNEYRQIVIDKSKIDVMPDDGRIVFIYPDTLNGELSKRQFLVSDIKIHGELSTHGGKKDNVGLEPSNKPVYYVGHEYAEAEATWKREDRKS